MQLTIEQQNVLHCSIETNKVLWKLYSKSFKQYIIIMSLLGVGLIVYNAFAPYTIHTQNEGKEIYYNINIAFSIGLALIILALTYLRHMLQSKSAFFILSDKHIGENSLQRKEGGVQVTNDMVKVISYNSVQEYSWNYFSHYKLKDEILFLLTDNSYLNAVAIQKAAIDKEKFIELLSLVEKRLVEKK